MIFGTVETLDQVRTSRTVPYCFTSGKTFMLSHIKLAIGTAALGLTPSQLSAEPTKVAVRVISADAKFVGDSMGGAAVTLRDARTGRLLVKGTTKGGTGDTKKIMEASGRSPLRATPDAAAFLATIDIDRPTLVEAIITGPNAKPQSAVTVRSQRWVFPGKDLTIGDGWTIELPGLAITPQITRKDARLWVEAKVELMCGCPITPGGLWDAAEYEVDATVWIGHKLLSSSPLAFIEAPGRFAVTIAPPATGRYRIVLFARNRKTGNSGAAELHWKFINHSR